MPFLIPWLRDNLDIMILMLGAVLGLWMAVYNFQQIMKDKKRK